MGFDSSELGALWIIWLAGPDLNRLSSRRLIFSPSCASTRNTSLDASLGSDEPPALSRNLFAPDEVESDILPL